MASGATKRRRPNILRKKNPLHHRTRTFGRTVARSHHAPSHLHDAPAAMALALIVLAIGSVLAGYAGVPAALGGSNALGGWLAPSFTARSVTTLADRQVGEAGEPGGAGEAGAAGLELSLMVVSSVVAIVGIGLAAFIWLKRREIADTAARDLSRPLPVAAEQVRRRRGVRRRDRAADPHRVAGRVVAGRRRPRDRRRGQRHGDDRRRLVRR